jgi:DUF917 family protein
MPGRLLFAGKIIDVKRDVSKGGYTVGRCLLASFSDDEMGSEERTKTRHLVIPFQNEFL